MLDKVKSSRLPAVAFATAMLVLGVPVAVWADDADDCASTTIAADRSAAACRRLAEQGKAWAQYNLGVAYEDGEGVKQDYKEALKWYRKAADQGHARAQNRLGWMYHDGKGVPQDDKQAVTWYRKAADQGYARAQNSLGWMYANGRGTKRTDVSC
ncbi:MAG TPA: tetratricopeptide repeat protein [Candidatus Acidoferrum sp.]|nr:tetratricopeptide repeat protein [Candidatus Acidoferrum sp.]